MEIIIILAISVVLSIVSVFALGDLGVFAAGIYTGIGGAWVVSLLTGFGNPTGATRTPTTREVAYYFVLWFLGGLLVYYTINLLVLLFREHSISTTLTLIWIACIGVLVIAYIARSLFLKFNKNKVHVTFGYDDELDYEYNGIYFALVKGKKEKSISFNTRCGSRDINQYGFRRDTSGSMTIYYKPKSIYISIRGYNPITLPINIKFDNMTLYLNKHGTLRIFVDEDVLDNIKLTPSSE